MKNMKCIICESEVIKIKDIKKNIHHCLNCKTQFISPQPTDEQLDELYSENYYKSWGISGQSENEAVKRMKIDTFDLRLDLIQQYKRNGRILDVGCATGFFLEAAKSRYFDPYGVEFSSYSSEIAKNKFGDNHIFHGILEESNFPDKFFDVIAMSDLIEHVRDPREILKKAKNLLKDDGAIMIMTPDCGSLTNKIMGKKWVHYKHEHVYYFNKNSMNLLAKKIGFKLIHYERARKSMNLRYFHTQFSVYPHWLLTPLVKLLYSISSEKLRNNNFEITMGEMVVILKKADL
jgi:2-polyprenyl-3-methyl-5-hydroxy-6-metoxy-1,4-benzoquinol methylase